MAKISADTAAPAPGMGDAAGTADLEAIKRQAKRARRSVDDAVAGARERRLEEEIEQLYAAEQWEEIGALYFNVRYATTGFKGFLLSEGQQKRLGASLALMMKILLAIDPKWLALIVFSVNFTTVIGEKEALWYVERKAEEPRRT